MARLSKMEEIDFPVKEQPVYVITGHGSFEQRIFVQDKKHLSTTKISAYWVLSASRIGW